MVCLPVFSLLLVTISTTISADEDCGSQGNCYGVGEILLDSDVKDKSISLHWQINNTEHIYGFQVIIENSKDGLIYESPILNKYAKSMVLNEALEGGEDAKVCVLVLLNMTEVIAKKCNDININDLQIYVGILAGVVFLIPCLAALSFIIYKDRNIANSPDHDPSEVKALIKPQHCLEILPDDNTSSTESIESVGKVNKSFQSEAAMDRVDCDIKLAIETEMCGSEQNAKDTVEMKASDHTEKEDRMKPKTDLELKTHEKEADIFVIRL